ncbi:MAG: ribosome-associated translation inhibitor RaiA [Planctomycetota bacterium]|nr:MAG: ribosome-associated translation inhibitor RaiA [Planctomycetota bacterium]
MIDIRITGVHYSVSAKVNAYITDKLSHLDRFHPGLQRLHVTAQEAAKHGFRIDVDMHLPNHKEVVAHHIAETIYAALDGVVDKCTKQLVKIHEKEQAKERGKSDRQRLRA